MWKEELAFYAAVRDYEKKYFKKTYYDGRRYDLGYCKPFVFR